MKRTIEPFNYDLLEKKKKTMIKSCLPNPMLHPCLWSTDPALLKPQKRPINNEGTHMGGQFGLVGKAHKGDGEWYKKKRPSHL